MKEYAIEKGKEISAPSGWTMIQEGGRIPHVHRYYMEGHGWSEPKRTISTMTPVYARRWGYMLAFAIPEGAVVEPWDAKTQKRIDQLLSDYHAGRVDQFLRL